MDTGVGIKEENLDKLFNAFSKIDNDSRSVLNPQGVGLGLMISNSIAYMLSPNESKGITVTS